MQGPIVVVSEQGRAASTAVLADGNAFPVVDASWRECATILPRVKPAAILMEDVERHIGELVVLAQRAATADPWLPVVVRLDHTPDFVPQVAQWPMNALPLVLDSDLDADVAARRLRGRIQSALRVRALHDTVLRRGVADRAVAALRQTDPLWDATLLLVGRGPSYPALSLAGGGHVGVVGALSIEIAARHLNNRDIDGVILGEGFSPRVTDAFLTVLAEDSRFRNLPVIIAGDVAGVGHDYGLPNFEKIVGNAAQVVALALPMMRQQAFETRLMRAHKSLDAGGLIDPRTGLLTEDAFARELAQMMTATQREGASTAARFAFDAHAPRASFDAARILSRLMRRADFAAHCDDHAVIVVFPQTDVRAAQIIVRRLTSVLKQTLMGADGKKSLVPATATVALVPGESAADLFARLRTPLRRTAS